MQLGVGVAPGKVILFGEHAVVYGRPALAAPINQVCATATVEAAEAGTGCVIDALDVGERVPLERTGHPLAAVVRLTLERLGLTVPDWRILLHSTIPIASGLGSGASVSAALIRAVASAAGQQLAPAEVSAMVYEIERLHHGTPSGVDNTVIAFGRPVCFMRGQPPQPFPIGKPFLLAIADTGIRSPTKVAVDDVRASWQRDTTRYEMLFDGVSHIVSVAKIAIGDGRPEALGPLMNENHSLLQEMGVSSRELDNLITAARKAGAAGAKLSGGGRGGNMIALVTGATAGPVSDALQAAGALRVIIATIQ